MRQLPLAAAILTISAVTVPAQIAQHQHSARQAVLWTDPGSIASRDLFLGSGAEERAPKSPFTFVKEDTDGTQPKVIVRDANGREWSAKFGEEVHSSIAASRLVWALGYVADELYYVADGKVTGAAGLKTAAKAIGPDGAFTKAVFRLRDESSERAAQRWTFAKNPFLGSQELSGLAILMTMLCNWDIQGDRNNRILLSGTQDLYIVSDLGSTFGRMGAFPSPRSKWNLADFQKEEFIERVEGGLVDLDYEGYGGINKVPLDHARWFAGLASQLTDKQLADAFRAAGASPEESAGFAARMREKIAELQKATGTTGGNQSSRFQEPFIP
jgi:hypothetical protein